MAKLQIGSGALLFTALLGLSASACSEAATPPGGPNLNPFTGAGTAGMTIAGSGGMLAGSAATSGASAIPAGSGGDAAGAAGAAGSSAGASGAAPAAGGSGAGGAGGSGGSNPGSGGAGSGGAGSGGAGSGGAGSGGAGSGGASGAGAGGAGAGGNTTPGNGGVVNATIVVDSGETFDGRGMRYTAGAALGDGSQSEGQLPVFRLEDGARLINVVLGAPAADGIHTYGDVTLEDIVWEDVGEDALTIKESGTVVLDGGSATNGEDKIFQINAASTFRVSNFEASNAGKFIRQNGGTTFRVNVEIDRCDISRMDEAIFRTDSSVSTVRMTNTRYSMIGDELFMGVNPANITVSNNTPY